MFLKSLEIRGFKSFADKTELKFKKGVTAVVGPNGSGKSNISDAVRWVLGEQSIKVLRGGKMEDVIFAGTQFRKPVGLAQVSLTLDNSDEQLATEYNEVTVSRRIFRSGESEYLINNNKCRLKDVTNLFMDTGIGKEGYSLIGQGKIEAILSGKPEERRALLEEAAGIVKFKNRKEEAEKKLSNTDDNLVRINDILSTYEERIEPLRIEREKAIEFKELSDNLKRKEVSLIVHTIQIMDQELRVFKEELNKRIEGINKKRESIAKDREILSNLEERIENIEKKTLGEKEQYYTLKDIINDDGKAIELYHERIKNCEEKIKRNSYEAEDISKRMEDIENNKLLLEQELAKRFEEQADKKEIIEKLEQTNKIKQLELEKMKAELKVLQESELDFLRSNSDVKNEINILKRELELREEKRQSLDSSISYLENNIVINMATYKGLSRDIENKKKEIEDVRNSTAELKKRIATLKGNITKKENDVKELNRVLTKLDANKTMLENLEKHYEGYNRSVKSLMESIKDENIEGAEETKVLGEVFSVDKQYETAVEIALGAAISNVITSTEQVAKKLIIYLKKNNLGRATFLPINIIKGKKLNLDDSITKSEGYIGIGSDIISYDSIYENIMNYTLGRTIICRDMDCALKISKISQYRYKIVTLEGEVVNPGGALTGGSIKGRNTNLLGRKREIVEVSKDESKLTEMKIAKAALDQGIEGKKNDFSRIEKESYDLSGKRDNLVRESKENEKSIIELNFSIKERQKNIEENNTKINVLELNFKDDEIEKEKLKEEFKQKDNLISAVMDEISREEMEVNKREVIKAKKESEEEHIYKKLNEELELTYAEALDICEPVENEEDLKSNISSIKSKITKLGIVNLAAIEEYEELKEKFEFMSNQAEDLEKAKEELIRVIDEMTGEMRILFKENFKILNHNFNETFKDLFQGGSAELILGEGDELSANIDINVEPPGKKLQNINLMSGGEKVLSAIALLFAILKMKPTPFCILDEIEAALDDANVYRYAEFLLRFSNRTQFIVITHRKGTMEASDIIYGVTMEEKGISKVVSVDLSKDDE
ncbi:chromosome segregation protein SMC [Clostridium butyricum]|uniref:chromosome segregation protein SMC n=1 Tax=Clostridium butyricum TaxID=1492 RepID=UPI00325B9152